MTGVAARLASARDLILAGEPDIRLAPCINEETVKGADPACVAGARWRGAISSRSVMESTRASQSCRGSPPLTLQVR
jgi:hypothetical protein